MATKEEMEAGAEDYADEFNKPEQPKREMTDEEAFGLTEPESETPAEEATESPAEAAAEPAAEAETGEGGEAPAPEAPAAPSEAAPSAADMEQRLKSWEGRLKARQAELDAREAAMADSSVNDRQESMPMGGEDYDTDKDGDGPHDTDHDGDGDPATVLADDFGQDFVHQLTKLIQRVTQGEVGGVREQVDQVVAALQADRMQHHFNTIAAAHNDFMDIVESPEFGEWKAAQPDQEHLQMVIDAGSAQQIIDMLTAFKRSTQKADNPEYADSLDAAEGVRSGGVSLPKEPTPADDFAAAWNEA